MDAAAAHAQRERDEAIARLARFHAGRIVLHCLLIAFSTADQATANRVWLDLLKLCRLIGMTGPDGLLESLRANT